MNYASIGLLDIANEALNLGGDTDTIGFITGTIASIYDKMDCISNEWID
ncbi:hypothetical protein [Bacillus sp. CGMCC 1.16541]|nr:hypothetical protein [Bacillus sp. CGMCC 1.16541]